METNYWVTLNVHSCSNSYGKAFKTLAFANSADRDISFDKTRTTTNKN